MAFENTISLRDAAVFSALILAGYVATLIIYRLWLSLLSPFPGSPLAKVTFWYEFYYDWVKPGQYYLKIQEMHEKYGPVIRITPEELHVADASYFPKIYVTGGVRKSDVYHRSFRGTQFEDYIRKVGAHDVHRIVRDPVQRYFSTSGVKLLEPKVVGCIRTFIRRLADYRDAGTPVNLSHALLSLVTDVTSTAVCEMPTNYLADPEFNAAWFNNRSKGLTAVPFFARLPWPLRPFILNSLVSISSYLPGSKPYELPGQKVLKSALRPSSTARFATSNRAENSRVHVGEDVYARGAELMQQAAVDMPTLALQTIITHLALDEQKTRKLRAEIAAFLENSSEEQLDCSWQTGTEASGVPRLPYLDACLKEGLRIGGRPLRRWMRVFPDSAIQVAGWVIPAGTPIGMCAHWMHMDPTVYPSPTTFEPERWLDANRTQAAMDYLVPFGRGSRECMGKNLGLMYMYHVLLALYRPGAPRLELFETDENDVALRHGYLYPMPKLDSKGVRVLVRGST